jgi:hypothetical protein
MLNTMPSSIMSATPFHAPIHDVIECQNGSHAGILGSDPAMPGSLTENIRILMTCFQDRRAEVVKV